MRVYLTALLLCLTAIVAGRGPVAYAALAVVGLLIPAAGWREWRQDVRERRLERLRDGERIEARS